VEMCWPRVGEANPLFSVYIALWRSTALAIIYNVVGRQRNLGLPPNKITWLVSWGRTHEVYQIYRTEHWTRIDLKCLTWNKWLVKVQNCQIQDMELSQDKFYFHSGKSFYLFSFSRIYQSNTPQVYKITEVLLI
jgi:hypothetical protein